MYSTQWNWVNITGCNLTNHRVASITAAVEPVIDDSSCPQLSLFTHRKPMRRRRGFALVFPCESRSQPGATRAM